MMKIRYNDFSKKSSLDHLGKNTTGILPLSTSLFFSGIRQAVILLSSPNQQYFFVDISVFLIRRPVGKCNWISVHAL